MARSTAGRRRAGLLLIRMLHLWEFADGRISRENLWLDGGSAVAQLSAP